MERIIKKFKKRFDLCEVKHCYRKGIFYFSVDDSEKRNICHYHFSNLAGDQTKEKKIKK